MSDKEALKPFPIHRTDLEAEAFVEGADLSEYDFSGFRPMAFDLDRTAVQVQMRIPQGLLDAVKKRADALGIPFTRYVRQLMEEDVARG